MTSNLLAALKSNQAKNTLAHHSPLIEAAKNGNLEAIEKVLDEADSKGNAGKIKIDQRDNDGLTGLMHASLNGYLDIVRYLLQKGARVSAKDDIGETSFMKAAREGQLHVVQYLIDTHLQGNKKKHFGGNGDIGGSISLGGGGTTNNMGGRVSSSSRERNPSKLAIQMNQAEKKRLLDAKDDEGITALMKCCEAGELEMVDFLVEEGATLDVLDDEGWTCLMWAALSGQVEILELLIREHGLPASFVSEKSESPLMKAAANGHWNVCAFLLNEGAKINHHDAEYQTSLMWAAAEGHIDTVQGLLDHDAKIDLTTKNGESALFYACQFGRLEAAKLLINKGANVKERNRDGLTCLFVAVRCGQTELCELLLDSGVPIEAHTQRGQNSLMWAAIHQTLPCVKLLVARKADLWTQDENCQTALDHAESTLNAHIVEELREAMKANPKMEDD